jgi:uncharacterized protein YciI
MIGLMWSYIRSPLSFCKRCPVLKDKTGTIEHKSRGDGATNHAPTAYHGCAWLPGESKIFVTKCRFRPKSVVVELEALKKKAQKEKNMKNRLTILIAAAVLVVITSFAVASFGRAPQQQQKQFALLMKATGPDFFKKTQEPEGKELVEKHFKKLQALTQQGVILFSGHTLVTDESGFGIIIVRAESQAEAQKIVDDDDLVKAGLIRGTVFPFEVVTSAK